MKDSILVEIKRDTTHVKLMSAQNLLYRYEGTKYTNDELINMGLEALFAKLGKAKDDNSSIS